MMIMKMIMMMVMINVADKERCFLEFSVVAM